jgi:hypothetical protein
LRRRLRAGLAELGSVPALGAVALLIANDHLFKAAFHNAITGKLSDVAICFLLPLLVSAVLGMATAWRVEARLWIGAAIGGAVFALMEMSDVAGDVFRRFLAVAGIDGGVLTRDPTDLCALVCVPLAVAFGRRHARRARLRGPLHPRLAAAAGAAALVAGSLGLVATSAPVRCDHYTAPVIFQADPGCGPGGLIVVDSEPYRGGLALANPAAVGLTPDGTAQSVQGQYDDYACPFTLDKGGWEVSVGSCSASTVTTQDAGSAPDAAGSDGAATRDASDGGVAAAPDAAAVGDASGARDASADAGTSVVRDASAAGDTTVLRDGGAGVDAGGTTGSGGGGGSTGSCPPASQKCKAALDDGGVLFLSCTRNNEPKPYCSSRLAVMP